jgi:hypothetical protein
MAKVATQATAEEIMLPTHSLRGRAGGAEKRICEKASALNGSNLNL